MWGDKRGTGGRPEGGIRVQETKMGVEEAGLGWRWRR